MGVFFSDWGTPQQSTMDARKNIKVSWFYYRDDDFSDEHIFQYFKFLWKPAGIEGWTHSSVKSHILPEGTNHIIMPPHSWAPDSYACWKIESWVLDKDWFPGQTGFDESGNPVDIVSGALFVESSMDAVFDTSGYVLARENNLTVANNAQGSAIVQQQSDGFGNIIPSDPGEYEVRVRVQNGFQWSPWSSTMSLKQYDTRTWVKKSGLWWAVPNWKKTGGSMTRIKR